MTNPLNRLKQRRREIAEAIAALQAEDAELAAAEVVVSRFVDDDQFHTPTVTRAQLVGVAATGIAAGEVKAEGKPVGTPTTPAMIMMLLKEAQAQGKPGLEPREMQISISRRWWPTVKSEDVGPTAWRMWKDGRLAKEGSLYMLPKNSEAADLPPGEDAAASG